MLEPTQTNPEEQSPYSDPLPQEPQLPQLQGGNSGIVFPLIITAVVFFMLGAMMTYLFFDKDNTSASSGTIASVDEAVQATFVALTPTATPPPTAVPNDVAVANFNPVLGPDDAPITIVEFSDYQCQFCARFHENTLKPLMEHYDGYVRFVYREYPIIGGQSSADISAAAQCAGAQGKYWEYAEFIWENQLSETKLPYDGTVLASFAEASALDMEQFNGCLADGTGMANVIVDFEAGRAWNFNATPGFFIQGIPFTEGAQPVERFIEIIDAYLLDMGIEPPPTS